MYKVLGSNSTYKINKSSNSYVTFLNFILQALVNHKCPQMSALVFFPEPAAFLHDDDRSRRRSQPPRKPIAADVAAQSIVVIAVAAGLREAEARHLARGHYFNESPAREKKILAKYLSCNV
jgi:hypothetical protein